MTREVTQAEPRMSDVRGLRWQEGSVRAQRLF
jgi:hypothetical protein